MSGLLTSKLRCPDIPIREVQRQNIIQRLNEGLRLQRQITLVSAPAGFGKTTIISQWVNRLADGTATWLSLDALDDDPGRFFTYLAAAIQKIDPDLCRDLESVIRSGQLPSSTVLSMLLINDLQLLNEKVLLILDDFHFIQDPYILETIELLIGNMPHTLHLVLITREDPPLAFARLRANNRLTEIRAKDLKFSESDTIDFFINVMNLSLSKEDIILLEKKTEGWIAGLQLAGLSIQQQSDPSELIKQLSGSHRFILGYLTEQVLGRQPEYIRQFLLQTSILDKLSADLCYAVTGRDDSRIVLDRLFNANLFLVPLDESGHWYRYHQLFADLLVSLQPAQQNENTAGLHQRASRWYMAAGMPIDAIRHALHARDYEFTVHLLENHALEMIMQGYIKTVNHWAKAIPEEWALKSPRTNLAFAWMYLLRGDFLQAHPYLEHLKENFGDHNGDLKLNEAEKSLKAEWFALQSLILYREGKALQSKTMATAALDNLHENEKWVHSLAYYALASSLILLNEYNQVYTAFQKSIQHGREANNTMAEMLSTLALSGIMLEQGQLQKAYEIVSRSVHQIEHSGVLHPFSAVIYAGLSDAEYHKFQLADAHRHLERAQYINSLGGSNSVAIACHIMQARLHLFEGDLELAEKEVLTAKDIIPVNASTYIHNEVLAQEVRVFLAIDRPAAVEMILQNHGFSTGNRITYPGLYDSSNVESQGDGITYANGLLFTSFLRFVLYLNRNRHQTEMLWSALDLADQVIKRALHSNQILLALELLLLRAQIHALLGEIESSRNDYIGALELAEPQGFISIFLEQGKPVAKDLKSLLQKNQLTNCNTNYIRHILQVFSESVLSVEQTAEAYPSPGFGRMQLIEPLTARELEVLHLMSRALKYKEIAAELVVSVNTVRFHVKSIYGKLNVSNRTQAIEAAHQYDLL